MVEQRVRIPSLDGLRAVSITFVLVDHLSRTQGFPLAIQSDTVDRWLEALGALGVRVFFVISGFLISTLLLAELRRRGSIHLRRFYLRRTLRIFVPYYACVAVILLLQLPGLVSLTPGDVAHALTYTMNYFPERSWDLGHGWSLSVEEQFYLAWPAVLLLGARRGLWVAATCLVLAPLIRIVYFFLFPVLLEYEVRYRFETVVDALAIGCLLAGASDWLGRQSFYRDFLASRLLIAVPVVVVVYAATLDPRTRGYLLIGSSAQNAGIALCMAWCVANAGSWVGKLLNSRPLVLLGLMSYSIYLWQQPFTNPFSASPVTRFPLNMALLAAASLTSYCFIERPSMAWRQVIERRFFGTRESSRTNFMHTPPRAGANAVGLAQRPGRSE
jgi:peptidoglycan/LPS O-acetylase OafA/YrhL